MWPIAPAKATKAIGMPFAYPKLIENPTSYVDIGDKLLDLDRFGKG